MRLVHFRRSSRHRKNPRRRHRRTSARRSLTRHRPNPARRHRASRRYRRNPGAVLKSVLSPSNFLQIGAITIGFVGGAKLGGVIYDKMFSSPSMSTFRRFAGLVTFALGTVGAVKAKGDLLKKAAAGVATAGIYDLIAQNMPSAGLKPVSGDTIDMRGVDLVGDNQGVYAGGDTIDVSGNMTELVGDDDNSVYA